MASLGNRVTIHVLSWGHIRAWGGPNPIWQERATSQETTRSEEGSLDRTLSWHQRKHGTWISAFRPLQQWENKSPCFAVVCYRGPGHLTEYHSIGQSYWLEIPMKLLVNVFLLAQRVISRFYFLWEVFIELELVSPRFQYSWRTDILNWLKSNTTRGVRLALLFPPPWLADDREAWPPAAARPTKRPRGAAVPPIVLLEILDIFIHSQALHVHPVSPRVSFWKKDEQTGRRKWPGMSFIAQCISTCAVGS